MVTSACIDTARKLAKNGDTRHLVFNDPSFLPGLADIVNCATAPPVAAPSSSAAAPSGNQRRLPQNLQDFNGLDPAFEAPAQASPETASDLRRVFLLLRDSCAGCGANSWALRATGLADAALKFAVDQAPFACEGVSQPPPEDCSSGYGSPVGDDTTPPVSAKADPEFPTDNSAITAEVGRSADTPQSSEQLQPSLTQRHRNDGAAAPACSQEDNLVRLAVRAALQFACNYCVGSEKNQALLWESWFSRGLMELTNGLKTDRPLLSLAIALIYNCCLSPPQVEGGGSRQESGEEGGGGRERLLRLSADKAFCCLLMKVVVVHCPTSTEVQAGRDASLSGNKTAGSEPSGGNPAVPPTTGIKPTTNANTNTTDSDDPAAEWLYLLFCRFVQQGLVRDVYDNVGIRGGGRSTRCSRRREASLDADQKERATAAAAGLGDQVQESVGVSSCAALQPQQPSNSTVREIGDGVTVKLASVAAVVNGGHVTSEGGQEQKEKEEGEDDFFFPVTPEQLIVLNLAEIAAGDEVVTGGEHPSHEQSRACDALVSWLVGLLSAMPLNQSLRPRRSNNTASAAAAASASAEVEARSSPKPESSAGDLKLSDGGSSHRHGSDNDDDDSDGEGSDERDGSGDGGGGGGVDWETERARRSMLEEARSAVLRSVAALLAGCSGETRRKAVVAVAVAAATVTARVGVGGETVGTTSERAADDFDDGNNAMAVPVVALVGGDEESATVFPSTPDSSSSSSSNGDGSGGVGGGGRFEDCGLKIPSLLPPPPPPKKDPETRLVPLCLRLLWGCGGAAEPKASSVDRGSDSKIEPQGTGSKSATLDGNVFGRAGIPAGRKVELLKVIGNACFRCQDSQDLVREVGGLPLVLNHCAVDGANPLLREYALLAVRNLCEGNPANQASIAGLQPQGCTPGMEEALADMGLAGRVDSQGKFRVDPLPPGN